MTSTKLSPTVALPRIPDELTAGLVISHAICLLISVLVVQAALGFKDAEDALGFYGVYHREPWNQFIHFFGVPFIIWSLFIAQAHLPLSSALVLRLPGLSPHYVSWATLFVSFYSIFYLWIDWVGALLFSPVSFAMYASAVEWTRKDQLEAKEIDTGKITWTGTGRLLRHALYLHLFAWYIQIHPGHNIIEGAKPAILDSLGGALTSAPLFAFYEGLWAIGLRKDLQIKVLELVASNTQALCAAGATMRACSSLP